MYFAVKQREDNHWIIDKIQEYFKYVGRIYQGKESRRGEKGGLSKPYIYYRVTKINQLQVIIDHFDKYPLQSKKKLETYNLWREMAIHKVENYRKADYDKLRALAEKLSGLNSQSRAFKVRKK